MRAYEVSKNKSYRKVLEEPGPEFSDCLFGEYLRHFSLTTVRCCLPIAEHRFPTTIFIQRAAHRQRFVTWSQRPKCCPNYHWWCEKLIKDAINISHSLMLSSINLILKLKHSILRLLDCFRELLNEKRWRSGTRAIYRHKYWHNNFNNWKNIVNIWTYNSSLL